MSSQQLLPRIDPEEEQLRQERRAARKQRRRQRLRTRIILWCTILSSITLVGAIGFFYLNMQAILNPLHPDISGLSCQPMEQNAYHIHVHLSIYINGKAAPIPQGIGIPSDNTCFYWLHTHSSDGIIHVEAPQNLEQSVGLDDFLTLWHDGFPKLNFPKELLNNTGWKIYVNGKPFTDAEVTSPLITEVHLTSHQVITLEYGTNNPAPDTFYAFPANLPT